MALLLLVCASGMWVIDYIRMPELWGTILGSQLLTLFSGLLLCMTLYRAKVSEAIAAAALKLIKVEYEEIPGVCRITLEEGGHAPYAITCGIYGYYFIYTVARDINIACDDDDEETGGLGVYILLSIVTCGLYGIWWEYKLGNRLQKNGPAFGLSIQENGTTILLWRLLGCALCFVGTFVGSYILIRNVNLICDAYNRKNGLT